MLSRLRHKHDGDANQVGRYTPDFQGKAYAPRDMLSAYCLLVDSNTKYGGFL